MKTKMMAVMALAVVSLYACDKGPFERAGEQVDDTVKDVRAGHKTTEHKLDNAANDAQDAIDDLKK